ncbi:hypothetical protein Y032_0087g2047 [Ancylostoma ceylanicum]|uniref:Reverse transcriptase domain-containing protein n=1 Tax=Ancylostoma ceylanicum TaxID=53326 RepID=A0A016TPX7_9BILA|nr:hypothetical protein Y032_0087g2047 [Ancylostoma ceylanicum]
MVICDSIRSSAKAGLQRKFDELLSRSQAKVPQRPQTLASKPSSDDQKGGEQPVTQSPRVTVIGGIMIPEAAKSLLELGPSFSPTQPITASVSRRIVGCLQGLQNRLRYRLKQDNAGNVEVSNFPKIPFPQRYLKQHSPNFEADAKFRIFATDVHNVLCRYKNKKFTSNLTPAQKEGIREVRNLVTSGRVRVCVSDKGGEFVILPQELDKAITDLHLQDETLYRPSSEEEFTKQYRKLNRTWVHIAKDAHLKPSLIARLKLELPICPVSYLLIKTHKLSTDDLTSNDPSKFEVRPIISCVDGPTDRVSWLLNLVLIQLLRYVPAHLSNTKMFLDHLGSAKLSEDCVMESFDVTSLYTNVSNDSAIQAAHEFLMEHHNTMNLYGLSIAHIMTLLKECLSCNIFRWSGRYYAQIRGLAMGQRLAPVLAGVFMAKIEQPVLICEPILYRRYVDDCFVICSTQEEMDKCFELLNQQSEYIKLTREKPRENWLPFLNVEIHLHGGTYRTKWFRKPSSRNIIVHYKSSHPAHTKTAVVRNMFHTAKSVCSGTEEKQESVRLARSIAESNGYVSTAPYVKRKRHVATPTNNQRDTNPQEKIPLCIPFISDELSRSIRLCLKKSGLDGFVNLVDIPSDNLKRRLVRNRLYDRLCLTSNCIICVSGRAGDCMISGTVYQISCKVCGENYIGETGRPLCLRIREHLEGKRSLRKSTPLGAHRVNNHSNNDFEVQVTILAQETDIATRKTMEAFWIRSRCPQMNRKDECLAITNELASYLDLCQLDPQRD